MAEDCPAVTTFGVKELETSLRRLRSELASGAVIHLVSKGNGRHRAWITAEPEPGAQLERVSCNEFVKNKSALLELAESGIVLEVADAREIREKK